jgi:hypothetical protein
MAPGYESNDSNYDEEGDNPFFIFVNADDNDVISVERVQKKRIAGRKMTATKSVKNVAPPARARGESRSSFWLFHKAWFLCCCQFLRSSQKHSPNYKDFKPEDECRL